MKIMEWIHCANPCFDTVKALQIAQTNKHDQALPFKSSKSRFHNNSTQRQNSNQVDNYRKPIQHITPTPDIFSTAGRTDQNRETKQPSISDFYPIPKNESSTLFAVKAPDNQCGIAK